MTNLSLNLTESAAMYPEATAIRGDGRGVTFAEFDDAAARLATFLEDEGLQPDDRLEREDLAMLQGPPAMYAAMRPEAAGVQDAAAWLLCVGLDSRSYLSAEEFLAALDENVQEARWRP